MILTQCHGRNGQNARHHALQKVLILPGVDTRYLLTLSVIKNTTTQRSTVVMGYSCANQHLVRLFQLCVRFCALYFVVIYILLFIDGKVFVYNFENPYSMLLLFQIVQK